MTTLLDRLIAGIFVRMEARARAFARERELQQKMSLVKAAPGASLGLASQIINNRVDPKWISIGRNTFLNGQLIVFPGRGEISVGHHCFIGNDSRIWSAAKITIGDYVMISHGVNIHDCNGHSKSWRDRQDELEAILPQVLPSPYMHEIGAKPISIGSHVWIGFNTIVRPGVTIGDRAIVGANTLITDDVACDAIVVGNPQRIIG